MNAKFYWISLVFMLTCNIVVFFHGFESKKKSNLSLFTEIENSQIHKSYILYESLGFSLKNTMIYRGNDKKGVLIDELCDRPRLVFRYNLSMCPPCIQTVLLSFEEVFQEHENNNNILFSCKNLEPRLQSSFHGKVNYSFVNDSLHLPIEDYQVPYMYIIDRNLTLKFLFVVTKGNRQEIIDYLNFIKVRYEI